MPVTPPSDACASLVGLCAAAVSFTVQPDGAVTGVRVIRSSRNGPCDQAITEAIGQHRDAAAGHPTALTVQVEAYTRPIALRGSQQPV